MSTFKKTIATAVVVGTMLANATIASAGKPVIDKCFGSDIKGFATNGVDSPDDPASPRPGIDFDSGVGWGTTLSGIARSPGADGHVGVGGEITQHQAGLVPDTHLKNSCNIDP